MADFVQVLNTIRDNASALYQERVPAATRETFKEVGYAVMAQPATQNEFLGNYINKIAMVEVAGLRFKNKLAALKKGTKPYGSVIEETYVNPATAVTFNGSATDDMLKVTKPDVKTIYHETNRRDKYCVSISNAQLREAFTSPEAFGSFHQTVLNSLYVGDEWDEYLHTRNLIVDAIAENKIKSVTVDYNGDDETSCKNLVKAINILSGDFVFPSKDFNGFNELNKDAIAAGTITASVTACPREKQVLLIRNDVDVNTDVEVLAKAFNMNKTDFLQRKIVVDSFGDTDTLCVLCDEGIFKIYDELYEVRSFSNGSNLTDNYWLHHWQLLSISLFGNAMAIKQAA